MFQVMTVFGGSISCPYLGSLGRMISSVAGSAEYKGFCVAEVT
jgi:hypothetical protein